MTNKEAMEVIENEKQCVIRAESCNRKCDKCNLVRDTIEIINAYNVALKILAQNADLIEEMTNYEKIKNMSVEEMASVMKNFAMKLVMGTAPMNVEKWLESEEKM